MSETFNSWAILELMGHRVRPGIIKEVEMFGGKLLRVDIPVNDTEFVTEFYGVSSIYALRPASEEIVRDRAYKHDNEDPRPIRPVEYQPEEPRKLTAQRSGYDRADDDAEPF